jgi:hypothetical protein
VNPSNEYTADLLQVKEQIRQAAARQRSRAGGLAAGLAPGAGSFNVQDARERLRQATPLVEAGTLPPLAGRGGWSRRLVLLLSQGVQHLGQFITARQTHYNKNLLEALRETALALHQVEAHLVRQQEHIRRLEALLKEAADGAGGHIPAQAC